MSRGRAWSATLEAWRPLASLIGDLAWLALAAALLIPFADRYAPPQDLPWKPLEITQAPGLTTHAKLNLTAGAACRTVLARGGVRAAAMPDRHEDSFCATLDAVRASPTLLSPAAPVMVCRQAAAYLIWERQVVQPLARAILGSPVARIEHYGTYACRRQYGARQGRVSEHALADAIDISGFVLADGRRVTIVRDWKDAGPRGRFVRAVRDGACRVFDVTLSPDYNAAHRDHLHLDMGPFGACR